MKEYNPIEQLDDRLKALYPNSEKETYIPKGTALGNFNAVAGDVLKGGGDIQDVMTKVRKYAPNIHSVQLAKIRDNLKAIIVSYTDNRAEWEKTGEKLDFDFEPFIKTRSKKEQAPKVTAKAPGLG